MLRFPQLRRKLTAPLPSGAQTCRTTPSIAPCRASATGPKNITKKHVQVRKLRDCAMDKYLLFVQWRNLPPQLPHCHGLRWLHKCVYQPLLPSHSGLGSCEKPKPCLGHTILEKGGSKQEPSSARWRCETLTASKESEYLRLGCPKCPKQQNLCYAPMRKEKSIRCMVCHVYRNVYLSKFTFNTFYFLYLWYFFCVCAWLLPAVQTCTSHLPVLSTQDASRGRASPSRELQDSNDSWCRKLRTFSP